MSDVTNNASAHRFELAEGGSLAILEYEREGERMVLTHTEVPEALAGLGVGSRLVRGALERLRAEGTRVVPRCSFVAGYIRRHPEYRAMVARAG
jgi:hypothetical protein